MPASAKWLPLLLALCPAIGPGVALADAGKAIDNERLTVWDVKLAEGASAPPTPQDADAVIMFLEGGRIRSVDGAGKASIAVRQFGDAVFVPRGSDVTDTLLSGGQAPGNQAHEIVIVLKDLVVPATPNTTPYPAAFPRPGSVKVIDNARVVVWHYSWTPGVPTPMHFHDKDVVVAYRYDGTLKSTAPDGTVVVNPYKAGDIRFNKSNRSHTEEVVGERQSAVMMELK